MNKDINLIEILKDAPKGTKLYSAIHGEVTLEYPFPYDEGDDCVLVRTNNGIRALFRRDGKILKDGECLLFPSKENRDWSTFIAPKKHKHFEPFQKILVANNFEIWVADLYDHYDEESHTHCSIRWNSINDNEILPYDGNEDKLGKVIE